MAVLAAVLSALALLLAAILWSMWRALPITLDLDSTGAAAPSEGDK